MAGEVPKQEKIKSEHIVTQWRPAKLLCKRFNIRDPYRNLPDVPKKPEVETVEHIEDLMPSKKPVDKRMDVGELMKEFSLGTGYGTLIRLDSNGRELERVQFTDQSAVELINRIAGGKFVALPPIQRPEIKDPVKEKVSEGMDKAKSMVSGEGTISGDPAPVPTAPARP